MEKRELAKISGTSEIKDSENYDADEYSIYDQEKDCLNLVAEVIAQIVLKDARQQGRFNND